MEAISPVAVVSVDKVPTLLHVGTVLVGMRPWALDVRVASFNGLLSWTTADLGMGFVGVGVGPWAP